MSEDPTAEANPALRRVLVIDFYVTDSASRPERYLDVDQFLGCQRDLEVCCADRPATDEELEERLGRWMRTTTSRLLLGYGLGPWVVLRNYLTLRRADVIICQGPHYFWLLLLLHRLRLLPRARRKAVRGVFFRTTGFRRKLPVFRAAPDGFQAAFATRQQTELLAREGAPASRLRYLPWRIDTGWFRPRADAPAARNPAPRYVLCPGSARRDEALVNALVGQLNEVKIIRMGRMPALQTVYQAALEQPGAFELRVNADHGEYLRLLQNAALVILPIVPCDEPAGLTAALEALACGVPLLANESAGIGPLLREAGVAESALLPDLEAATWKRGILRALASSAGRESAESWRRARAAVVDAHSIRADDPELHWFLGPASEPGEDAMPTSALAKPGADG